jgi:hypothetical protein
MHSFKHSEMQRALTVALQMDKNVVYQHYAKYFLSIWIEEVPRLMHTYCLDGHLPTNDNSMDLELTDERLTELFKFALDKYITTPSLRLIGRILAET